MQWDTAGGVVGGIGLTRRLFECRRWHWSCVGGKEGSKRLLMRLIIVLSLLKQETVQSNDRMLKIAPGCLRR